MAAGFARPEDQAQGFLAVSMRRAMQSTDARTLPPLTEGTQVKAGCVVRGGSTRGVSRDVALLIERTGLDG